MVNRRFILYWGVMCSFPVPVDVTKDTAGEVTLETEQQEAFE